MIFLKTNKLFFVVFFFTAIISNYAQNVNLKIIETSDIHGAIYPFNFTENKKSNNSMAQIFSYVKSERENKNQQLKLISYPIE